MKKTLIDLFQEFEENGYIQPNCPKCGEETEPTEPDAGKAYCSNCDEYVKVPMLC